MNKLALVGGAAFTLLGIVGLVYAFWPTSGWILLPFILAGLIGLVTYWASGKNRDLAKGAGFVVLVFLVLVVGGVSWSYCSSDEQAKPAQAVVSGGATTQTPAPPPQPRVPTCQPNRKSPEYSENSKMLIADITPDQPLTIKLTIKPRLGARWKTYAGKLDKQTHYKGNWEIVTLTPSTATRIEYFVYPCLN